MSNDQLTGRDLGAAIAVKLFGWRWCVVEHIFGDCGKPKRYRVFAPGSRTDLALCADGDMELPMNTTPFQLPSYSTDWDAMRLVVEAMMARGWWCRMDTPFTNGDPDPDDGATDALFEAGFFRHGYAPNQAGMFHANLLPEAVCRAALKALEKHQSPLRETNECP